MQHNAPGNDSDVYFASRKSEYTWLEEVEMDI